VFVLVLVRFFEYKGSGRTCTRGWTTGTSGTTGTRYLYQVRILRMCVGVCVCLDLLPKSVSDDRAVGEKLTSTSTHTAYDCPI
jgi:hypothetical protein